MNGGHTPRNGLLGLGQGPPRFARFVSMEQFWWPSPGSVWSRFVDSSICRFDRLKVCAVEFMGNFETVWWAMRLTFSLRYEAVWFRGLLANGLTRYVSLFFSFGQIRFARYGFCTAQISGLNRGVAFLTPKRFERYANSLQFSGFVSLKEILGLRWNLC